MRLSKLDASNNAVEEVTVEAFDNLHQTLLELDLAANNLSELAPAAFRHVHSVLTLNLRANNLGAAFRRGGSGGGGADVDIVSGPPPADDESLDDDSDAESDENPFEDFHALQSLDLGENDLTTIRCQVLASLPRLVRLRVAGNRVRRLRDVGVGCTKALARLDAAGNRLERVDVNTLLRLDALEELDLGDNPFRCGDCSLVAMARWANATGVRVVGRDDPDRYRCIDRGGDGGGGGSNDGSIVGKDELPAAITVGRSIFSFADSDPVECRGRRGTAYAAGRTGPADDDDDDGSAAADRRLRATVVSTAAGVLLFAIAALLVAWRHRRLCHGIKTLHYRWQVRYREVSDLEAAIDGKITM